MPHRESAKHLNEIEIILIRQLASALTMPLMIFDPQGSLLFYNEPAEPILGQRFEETGRILVSELSDRFAVTDERHQPLPPEVMPSHIVLTERRPASSRFWIRGLDGVQHHVEISSFPLVGRENRLLGALSVLWELEAEPASTAWSARSAQGQATLAEALIEGL
jgi:PAS domain-containing protein